MRDNINIDT